MIVTAKPSKTCQAISGAGIALLITAAFSAVTLPALGEERTRYIEGFDALPLMPGLEIAEGGPLIFDKPDGRIVQVSLTGNAGWAAISAYYGAALPPLGWVREQDTVYRRDGEILHLRPADTAGEGAATPLTISLEPD